MRRRGDAFPNANASPNKVLYTSRISSGPVSVPSDDTYPSQWHRPALTRSGRHTGSTENSAAALRVLALRLEKAPNILTSSLRLIHQRHHKQLYVFMRVEVVHDIIKNT